MRNPLYLALALFYGAIAIAAAPISPAAPMSPATRHEPDVGDQPLVEHGIPLGRFGDGTLGLTPQLALPAHGRRRKCCSTGRR